MPCVRRRGGRGTLGLALLVLAIAASPCCRRGPAPPSDSRPLRVLMGADVTTLDPQIPFDNVHTAVFANIFDSLVRFDSDLRLSASLAERWINPDERTWRFFLSKARFPDGSPLRASDVRFSIERLASLPGSQMQGFTQHISSVDVVDELTIDLHTDTPISILNDLAFIPIMSERHVRSVGDRVSEIPFGTGPYKLVRWERGRSILLEANPHHEPAPGIRHVEFAIRDDDRTLPDEILRMHPDLALFVGLTTLEAIEGRKGPDLEVVSSGGLAVFYATFNVRSQAPGFKGKNPLQDLRVRRALAHATGQSELLHRLLKGFGRPAAQLIVPQVFGFDPGIKPVPHDPVAGRELLAQAGYPDLDLPIYTSQTGSHRFEKLLIEQWGRIGVRARMKELGTQELQRALETGAFTVALQGYSCTSGDASEIVTFCLQSRDPVKGYGMGNYSGYSNPDVDRISEENIRVLDPRKRLRMLQGALRIASQDMPHLPLYSVDDIYLVSHAIRWVPRVDGEIRVSEIAFTSPGAPR